MSDSVFIKDNTVVRSEGERVTVYIDLNNVYRGARDRYPLYKIDVDYGKMVKRLIGNGKKVCVYVFDGIQTNCIDPLEDLHDNLRDMDFEVCLRVSNRESRYDRYGIPHMITVQKGVDGALMTKLLTDCFDNIFDTAIIVSADRDFTDAAIEVRKRGKNVECATFDTGCQFMHICNSYCDLDCLNVVDLYTKNEYRHVSFETKDDGTTPVVEDDPALEEESQRTIEERPEIKSSKYCSTCNKDASVAVN